MIFTVRHRKCLQNGRFGGPNGENEAQLYTGAKIRQECLDEGWLERWPDSLNGTRMYRTTELGWAMLDAPAPTKANTGPKIKVVPQRIATFGPRIAKPLPRNRFRETDK